MTLYLVKWVDGTSALISAADEEDLVELLDELADPGAASWQEYEGPVWLEFPRIDAGLPDGDVDPFQLEVGAATVAETDCGGEFERALVDALHPNVAGLRERAISEARSITRAELTAAVEADLGCELPGSQFRPPPGPAH